MHSNNVFQYSKIRARKRNAKKSIKTVKNWNPALFGIQNPLYWNPESTEWNPESKNVLDSLTWGEGHTQPPSIIVNYFSLYAGFTVFSGKRIRIKNQKI